MTPTLPTAPRRHFCAVLCLVLCCLLLSACLGALQSSKSTLPPPSNPAVGDARKAWDNGDMRNAETLYEKVTKITNLPLPEQNEAWSRLAQAAQRNARPHRAMDALSRWLKADPSADNLPLWQDTWYNTVLTLPLTEALKQATLVWTNKKRSADARAMAGLILLGRSWQTDASLAALPVLRESYARQGTERRILLEQRAANEVRYMAPGPLTAVAQKGQGKTLSFPASVLLLEQTRRGQTIPGLATADIMTRLRAPGVLADPALIGAVMGSTESGAASTPPASIASSTDSGGPAPSYASACLVLALPASGPTAPIADKIRAGAMAAQAELRQTGASVQLHNVDTMLPDWLTQLQALPPQCVVVGGPLRAPVFTALKSAQAPNTRHFFTFLPQLEGGDEGSLAWRFFPSPQDQVAALLRFAKDDLGIKNYGAFSPADNYGPRMAGIFEQAVRQGGGTVRAASYTPANTAQWPTSAQTLLETRMVNNVPQASAALTAVFLPDSWKNMDLATAALRSGGGQHLILLGTSLWEQSLSGQSNINMQNYGLAIFPGLWNPTRIPGGLSSVAGADFWVGLGYDFVRFGAALDIQEHGSASTVNSRIQKAQHMPWGMAPITWNGQGVASQQLFLFTPAPTGFVPLNPQEFKARRAEASSSSSNPDRPAAAPQGQ